MKSLFIYLVALLSSFAACIEAPLIGVLTKPFEEEYPDIKSDYTEVVEAKYVHFIEGGGGRAVAISYKWDKAKIQSLMSKLNGVLFTGGAAELTNPECTELTEYSKGARHILDIALEFNKNENYFPVWGTCLGFELIMILESENTHLLKSCTNCANYNIYLQYDREKIEDSKLFKKGFTGYQLDAMSKQNITYNNHQWMVDKATYDENELLVEKYNVMAYSPSANGEMTYIAAVEHKKYPIYAIQFHPEKYNYEVNPDQPAKKTRDSITVSHAFANFFIEEARKNNNSFRDRVQEMENVVQHSHSYYHPKYGHLYGLVKKTIDA